MVSVAALMKAQTKQMLTALVVAQGVIVTILLVTVLVMFW